MTAHPHLITLGRIRDAGPCQDGYGELIRALGTSDLDTVLSIGDVQSQTERLTLSGACVFSTTGALSSLPSCPPVKRAAQHTTDARVHECIATLNRWLAGDDAVDFESGVGGGGCDAGGGGSGGAGGGGGDGGDGGGGGGVGGIEVGDGGGMEVGDGGCGGCGAAKQEAAGAEELQRQVDDLIEMFPLYALKNKP